MSTWNDGYVNDIDYTYGYYAELNPNHMIVPFLMEGLEPPKVRFACELGFGQGLSVNVHAAAQDTKWYGTDFNPSQTQFAQMLSREAGTDAHLVDQSFEEFCYREDLPQFDYIALHGIWSWVSPENQAILVDFIRRKLNVGGVLYISYNTLPGWSMFAPLRHIAAEHANIMGAKSTPSNTQAVDSLQFSQKIIEASSLLKQHVPELANRVNSLIDVNSNYLAHEYFNQHWKPMYFSEVANLLDTAKLRFATRANYLDEYASTTFNDVQKTLLNEQSDTNLRETVKDFFLNRQFRRDYWVKGGRVLSKKQLNNEWDKLNVLIAQETDYDEIKIQGSDGSVGVVKELYQPILDVLRDRKIHNVKELRSALPNLNAESFNEVLAILISRNIVLIVQDNATIEKSEQYTKALNVCLLNENLGKGKQQIDKLASPVTGGAVSVTFMEQIFLQTYNQGKKDIKDWNDAAWNYLQSHSQKLVKEEKVLETQEDSIKEITRLAEKFRDISLPFFISLKIA